MSDRFQSFEEFWPYYVLEHSKKANRMLHFAGTTAAVVTLGVAAIKRKPALIPLALVAGYGPAWIGHFFVEKNRPATFKYPLWSLLADFRMWGKTIRGTMNREVERQTAKRQKAEEVHAPTNGVAHSVN
ncbi:MAG: DUF962 domain-containing protein [Polyangiaceae bacterium]|nr:DUF962 domain-containing protein [Polyangiaceae bacterium]